MSTSASALSKSAERTYGFRRRTAAVASALALTLGSALVAMPVAAAAPPTIAASSQHVGALVPGTKSFGQAVLAEAAKHRGKPYRYGGNGPRAFDCSGFTRYVYKKVGKRLPRTAAAQRAATKRISRSQVRPGDLVFVHKYGRVTHAAIYAGGNRWWEASRPGRPLNKNRAWTSSVSYGRVR